MAHVETALFQRLNGNVALNAVVEGRIFPAPAPQDSRFPLVTYEEISATPFNSHEVTTATIQHRMAVTAWSENRAETDGVKNVGILIAAALIGWQQTELLNRLSRWDSDQRKHGIRQDFRVVNVE